MARSKVPDPFEQPKGGGFSSPTSVHIGENGVSRGGMTIWDEYVLAIAPEIFRCAPDSASQTEIAAGIATMADAMLEERKKREIGNAG